LQACRELQAQDCESSLGRDTETAKTLRDPTSVIYTRSADFHQEKKTESGRLAAECGFPGLAEPNRLTDAGSHSADGISWTPLGNEIVTMDLDIQPICKAADQLWYSLTTFGCIRRQKALRLKWHQNLCHFGARTHF
jgi:hypothetical protein